MTDFNKKRLLNVKEAAEYIGLGTTRTKDFCKEIGAEKRFGRRVLYDRVIIDKAIDYMEK